MHDNRIALNQEVVENILNDKNYSLNHGVGLVASNLQKINVLNENRISDKYREPNFTNSLRNSADFPAAMSARSSGQYESDQPQLHSPMQRDAEKRLKELSLSPKQRTVNQISAYENVAPNRDR